MADADLFMECEEEELEPWQQMNDDVDDEEVSIVESKSSTVSDSARSESPSLTPAPSAVSSGAPSVPMTTEMTTSSASPLNDNKSGGPLNTVTSPVPPVLSPVPAQPLVPPLVHKQAPGQQLILTQGAGGLGAVAMPQVLQSMQVMPGAAPIVTAASTQPIYFTTQGFPVQNVRPVQSSVSPVGIVLNVQPGQTVRPITLVSAPGAQFFKPTVGVPQVVSQPAPVRPGTLSASQPPTSTYTTVQIPATLTIRSNAPLAQQTVSGLGSAVPSAAAHLPPPTLPPNPQSTIVSVCGIPPVTQLDGLDPRKVATVVPSGPSPLVPPAVLNKSPSNGLSAAAGPSTSSLDTVKVVPTSKLCPRCGAQFRVIEALRGHMCFCCPELTQNLSVTEGSKLTSVMRPAPSAQPQAKVLLPQNTPASGAQLGDCALGVVPDSQAKLIMLVDDFYYGSSEGSGGHASQEVLREPAQFKCLSCSKKLKNNIRLMNHMKHHVELEQQNGEVDTHTYCLHCYRQFPTPFQLQCHLESVHSTYESTTKCKICEWAFESEPVFLQHMKNTHKPGEMPYVCQVCDFRSSHYCDVFNHFRTLHEDTRYLLCLYCLKVFKNSNSYQQHYVRHQKKTVYHCNKCRLQFLFTKDKMDHKLNHHKTFRKPKQLEGLLPGTKVTIRAYAMPSKPVRLPPAVIPGTLPAPTLGDTPSAHVGDAARLPPHSEGQQPALKKKSVSKMLELLTKFQEQRALLGTQTCLECNYDIPDFANHFPTYVHCSLCRYSTCCSRAYANHMINNHVPRKSTKYLALYRKPVPSWVKLTCTSCKYSTLMGDLMAKHLQQNPSHSHSLWSLKGSAKVGFVMESQRYTSMKNLL